MMEEYGCFGRERRQPMGRSASFLEKERQTIAVDHIPFGR